MKLEEKNEIINSLAENLAAYSHFYLTDTAQLNAAKTSALRRECFSKDIKMIVVKNKLLKRALEQTGKNFDELFGVLKGSTSIMFSNTGNDPAKLIKEFRKKNDKPVLKGAYVEESFYIGDNQLDALVAVKSKDELLGDLIALLQSPAKNVISALQSGSNIIHGVLETLSKREN
ncbi:MAG: 50S ribosomal protein L10 [Bacteroidia bacterium]|nr:MAG: 50S ribosomal protein L10 [Bacteroidia bacterium]